MTGDLFRRDREWLLPQGCSLVLVGETNPLHDDPRYALWDDPPGCSGWRLRRILGLSRRTYRSLARVNLCVGDYDRLAADLVAARVEREVTDGGVIVMLGRKVAAAFCASAIQPLTWARRSVAMTDREVRKVALPHPSGLSRAWNELDAAPRARLMMRELCPELPWGEEKEGT